MYNQQNKLETLKWKWNIKILNINKKYISMLMMLK